MHLTIGERITGTTIEGKTIDGTVTAILENTVILFCGIRNHMVSKKELTHQGYEFTTTVKERVQVVVVPSKNTYQNE